MPIDRRTFLHVFALSAGAAGLAPAQAQPTPALSATPLRRAIPGTAEMLPVIGLGTADTFNADKDGLKGGPLDTVMGMMLRTPGSVLDTAPSYGSAEAVTGELMQLHGARKQIFLATKISASAGAAAQAQWAQSQRDLRSDTVDLLQVHNLVDWRDNLRYLRQLKAEHKTRYVGVTHYRADALDTLVQIVRTDKPDFVQINYSVAEREAERVLLPLCQERGVAVLINRPFQDGRMFRAVQGKPVPAWAADIDCASWGQLFLKFIVGHPAVTTAIPATSNPRHMQDNLRAGVGRMPDAAMRARIAAELA